MRQKREKCKRGSGGKEKERTERNRSRSGEDVGGNGQDV